jgi:hypothetical protein
MPEHTVSSLGTGLFDFFRVIFLLEIELLPEVSLLHKELQEVFFLGHQLRLIVVNKEWSHYEIVKTLKARSTRIELLPTLLNELRLGHVAALTFRGLLVLAGLHCIRV